MTDALRQTDLVPPTESKSSCGQPDCGPRGDATVLIVDPDAADAGRVRSLAIRLGFAGFVFTSADELLWSPLVQRARACIVSEMLLPDIDGLGLLRALGERGARPPVIFLTRDRDVHHAVAAIRAGALDYQVKPLVEQRLMGRLLKALGHPVPGAPA